MWSPPEVRTEATAKVGGNLKIASRYIRPARSLKFGMLVAGVTALGSPLSAPAVDIAWDDGTGDWSTATNWNPDQVPGPADLAIINNGGTAQIGADIPQVNGIRAGEGGGNTGTIVQTAGNVVFGPTAPDTIGR